MESYSHLQIECPLQLGLHLPAMPHVRRARMTPAAALAGQVESLPR